MCKVTPSALRQRLCLLYLQFASLCRVRPNRHASLPAASPAAAEARRPAPRAMAAPADADGGPVASSLSLAARRALRPALAGGLVGATLAPIWHAHGRQVGALRLILGANYAVGGLTYGVLCEVMRITSPGGVHSVDVSARAGAGTGLVLGGMYHGVLRGKLKESYVMRTLMTSFWFGTIAVGAHLAYDSILTSRSVWELLARNGLAEQPVENDAGTSTNAIDTSIVWAGWAWEKFKRFELPEWSPIKRID